MRIGDAVQEVKFRDEDDDALRIVDIRETRYAGWTEKSYLVRSPKTGEEVWLDERFVKPFQDVRVTNEQLEARIIHIEELLEDLAYKVSRINNTSDMDL